MDKIRGNKNYVELSYGNNNNYIKFKNFIELKGLADYGEHSSVITSDAYNVPKEDTAADLLLKGFDIEQVKIILADNYNSNKAILKKFNEDKKRYYAFIMLHCSAESQIAIRADSDYESADSDKCALKLWRIIKRTHVGGITSQNARVNKNKIKRDYTRIEMKVEDDIVTFYNHFLDCAANYCKVMGQDIKDKKVDIEMAWDLFESLPDSIYGEFKGNYKNGLNDKSQKEDISLNEMYNLAKGYKPISKIIVKNQHAAVYAINKYEDLKFNAKLDDYSGDESDGEMKVVKAKGRSRAQKDEPKGKAARRKPKPIEHVQCYGCHKLGHYKVDCPDKEKSGDKEKAVSAASAP